MPIAELILDTQPKSFGDYYIKVTDQETRLVVLSASDTRTKRLINEAGDTPGLYVLQADDSSIYVGQSKALEGRLKNHKTNNKIGFRRVMVMLRDQGLSQYLDYAEAKLYCELEAMGYSLSQNSLGGSTFELRRNRLAQLDRQHVDAVDRMVAQFLTYVFALGLDAPTKVVWQVNEIEKIETVATEPSVQPEVSEGAVNIAVGKGYFKKLTVRTVDGTQIFGSTSADVFVNALAHLGLKDVMMLGLTLDGQPLVSREMPLKYQSSVKKVGGFYIMTHSSTPYKARKLRQIIRLLGKVMVIELL